MTEQANHSREGQSPPVPGAKHDLLTLATRSGRWAAVICFAIAGLCLGCVAPSSATPSPQLVEQPEIQALACLKSGIRYPHNPAVRVEAIEAMESAGDSEVLPWIRSALLDEHPAVRFAACITVGNARDHTAAAAIEKCARDENASVRVAALYARHRLGRTDYTGRIVTYLLQHDDPMVRRNAAFVLGLIGEPGAVSVLARAVKDDVEPGVRHHALEAMARLGNAEARQELTFMTNSGVGSDEVMAVQALAATRDPRFAETFRYKLGTATHLETKLAAARALGMVGEEDGYDIAVRGLTEEHAPVNDQNDPPAGQELRVKLLAAAALGAIGRTDALGVLAEKMQRDTDPRVQIAAARAILEIAGKRAGLSPFAAAGQALGTRP